MTATLPPIRFERFSVSVQATTLTRKKLILRRVQRLIHGLDRVEQAYGSSDTTMKESLVVLSAAAHALVAPNASPAALAPLADAFASAPSQPPADVTKLIEKYAYADKTKLQALADDGDVAAKECWRSSGGTEQQSWR